MIDDIEPLKLVAFWSIILVRYINKYIKHKLIKLKSLKENLSFEGTWSNNGLEIPEYKLESNLGNNFIVFNLPRLLNQFKSL